MGRFINGMFIGAGIALLVAPMRGEEMRSLLRERFQELQGSLPESDTVNQYAQQAASQVKQTAANATDQVKQSAKQAKRTGQNIAGATNQNIS